MNPAVLAESDRRAYQANIARFFVYSTLQNFQLWIPIWIIYLQEQRGLSLTEITFLDAPFFLSQVLAEVPTGALADRFGRKTSLLLGGAVVTIGVFVFGIADNYPLIVTSYLFWGIGMTLQSGADQAFLYDSLKLLGREADYSRTYGRLNAATIVASILAGLIGAPLAAQTSLATPVLASAAICGLSALVALTFREPPQTEDRLPYLQTIAAGVSEVWRRPAILGVMAFSVVSMMVFFVPQYFQQPLLKSHDVSTASLGLFLLPARLTAATVSMGAHRVEARFGGRTAIALAPVVGILVCFGLAAWDSIYAFALVSVAAGAGTLRMLLISNYINSRIPSEQRATILSIFALAAALFSSLALPVCGYLADQHSLRFLYGAAAIFCSLTLPFILFLWRRAERIEASSGATPVPGPEFTPAG